VAAASYVKLPDDHPVCGFNNELCTPGILFYSNEQLLVFNYIYTAQ